MSWSYLSSTWTSAEQLAWRQHTLPVMCGFSLSISVIAAVVYYIFPRMRVFPRNVFIWPAFYNIIWNCYIIWKWAPGSSLTDSWVVDLKPGTPSCKAGIFFDNFTINGDFACNTLLVLTIFLTTVMEVKLTQKSHGYFYSYVAFVVLFPITIGLIGVSGNAFYDTGGATPCEINSKTLVLVTRVPGFILLGIQALMLGISLLYMRYLLSRVNSNSADYFPMKYLVIRFTTLYVAQLFNILPTQIFVVSSVTEEENAIFVRFVAVTHGMGGSVDGIVQILGNPDFMAWIRPKIANFASKFTRVPPQRNNAEAVIEMGPQSTRETPGNDQLTLVQNVEELAVSV